MIISVEGIIGSGKTTFIKHLAKILNADVLLEPVDKWKKSGILQNYYADISKWAFPFQIQVITDKIEQLNNINKTSNNQDTIIITERSIYSDKCFMDMFYTNKKITQLEYDLYNKIWTMLEKNNKNSPDLIIYLQPSLQECMQRVKKRNRSEEHDLTPEYQQDLMNLHDIYFDASWLDINDKKIPIIKFNNTLNIATDKEYEQEVVNKIHNYK